MKNRKWLVAGIPLLVFVLMFGTIGFATDGVEPGPHGSQSWEIALGSSFAAGSPVFDTWLQWNILPRAFALRLTSSVIQVIPGTGTFAFSLAAVGTPYIYDFGLYFGLGAGATLTVSGGDAAGMFTSDAIAGLTIPIADIIGFYAQARMLGVITGGTFDATILPGFGFYILF